MGFAFSLISGLPGKGMLLHLDALSLFFVVLMVPQMLASGFMGLKRHVGFWGFGLGWALAVLAGNGFSAALGVGLMLASCWLLRLSSASVPLCGAGLRSGGLICVLFYAALRAQSVAPAPLWGVAIMLLGLGLILSGARQAVFELALKNVISAGLWAYLGVVVTSLGLAWYSQALGHTQAASLAFQAVLLGIVVQGLLRPLLFIAVFEAQKAVGTSSLNWLGGLMRGMPRLGALMLLGLVGLAALPLGPGFAPMFLLVHALSFAAQGGGVVAQGAYALVLASVGFGLALSLIAGIRVIGLGFLGRPRSLHAAAAEDIQTLPFWVMAGLGALLIPLAVVPKFILFLCAPVLCAVSPQASMQGFAYAPLVLWLLIALALLALGFVQTRFGQAGLREVPAWNDGFGRPPAWLPFGDPQTQTSASSLTQPLSWLNVRLFPKPGLMRRTIRLVDAFWGHWAGVLRSLSLRAVLGCALVSLVLSMLVWGG